MPPAPTGKTWFENTYELLGVIVWPFTVDAVDNSFQSDAVGTDATA